MAEAINRSVDNDGNDVDVLVVVVVTVVFLSEGVIVLALIIAEDAVDCVSIVGIIDDSGQGQCGWGKKVSERECPGPHRCKGRSMKIEKCFSRECLKWSGKYKHEAITT